VEVEIIEIFLAVIATGVVVTIALLRYFNGLDKRITTLETCIDGRSLTAIDQKTDILLDWIRSLNGEISNEQFLKRLEIVTKNLEAEEKKRLNLKD